MEKSPNRSKHHRSYFHGFTFPMDGFLGSASIRVYISIDSDLIGIDQCLCFAARYRLDSGFFVGSHGDTSVLCDPARARVY